MSIFPASDGTRPAHRLVGEGEPLICLPGGAIPAAADLGRLGAPRGLGDLGGLTARRQLVLLDGLDATDEPAAPADAGSARRVRQVADVEALRAHLALERIDLLAHAAGGDLAVRYAVAHPDRVRGLVLIAPAAPPAATRAAAAALDAPVLVFAGDPGAAFTPARAADTAALFPHGEVAVQRGAGHFGRLDDPRAFGRTVAAFLDPEVHGVRLPGGNRIAYRTWGEPAAPPVVLLHGRTAEGAGWREVAEALSTTRRVYAPDFRGHGLSDWPGDYAYPRLAADVREFLDALGLGRVDLVGHSMGGAVALQVAEAEPERVGRLVLEDAPPPFPVVPPLPPAQRPGPAELLGLAYDWDVLPATDEGANHPDPAWAAELGAITAPTLVLSGGPASFLPEADQRRLADLIPGSRAVTLPVGHLIHRTDPKGFLAELKGFGLY